MVTDDDGAFSSATVNISDPPPTATDVLYYSLNNSATVAGVSAANEDVLVLQDDGGVRKLFDGSDVGLGGLRIDAFDVLSDNEILMSFSAAGSIADVGTVDDSDLVLFTATSLGETTAGTFSMVFDGSDVELSSNGEDIDAMQLLDDGRLLISTTGSPRVTGVSGDRDEDLLAFTPTSLGANTTGTWAMYFDGSDVGLASSGSEDVDALAVGAGGVIHLSTVGSFSVSGAAGDDEDVMAFSPSSLGSGTSGSFNSTLVFDGSTFGLAGTGVGGIDLALPTGPAAAPAADAAGPAISALHRKPSSERAHSVTRVREAIFDSFEFKRRDVPAKEQYSRLSNSHRAEYSVVSESESQNLLRAVDFALESSFGRDSDGLQPSR